MSVTQSSSYVIGASDINKNSKQTVRPYIVRAEGYVPIPKHSRKKTASTVGQKMKNASISLTTKKFGYPMYDSKINPTPSGKSSGSKPSSGSGFKPGGSKPGSGPAGPQPSGNGDVKIKPEKLKIETVVKPEKPKPVQKVPGGFPITPTTQEKMNTLNDLVQLVDSPNTIDKLKKLKDLDKLKKPKSPTLKSPTTKSPATKSPLNLMNIDLPIKKRPTKKRETIRITPYTTKKPNKVKKPELDELKDYMETVTLKNRLEKIVEKPKRKVSASTSPVITKNNAVKRKGSLKQSDQFKFARVGEPSPVITKNNAVKRKGSLKQSDQFKFARVGGPSTEEEKKSEVRIVGQKRRNAGLQVNTAGMNPYLIRRAENNSVAAASNRDPRAQWPAIDRLPRVAKKLKGKGVQKKTKKGKK
jgi:hypothetical protein